MITIDTKKIIDAKVILKNLLRSVFQLMTEDSSWYDLYKSITSEKDLAEKDQHKMVRTERRRIRKEKTKA